jgi:hypothetical protein
MPTTSTFGAQLGTEGTLIQALIGSPAAYATIANAYDMTLPTKANTVETTNFGDAWIRRFPTLLDMGAITFKVYFIPLEPTHNNTIASTTTGLRYLMINKILTTWKIVYPDGSNTSDAFPAYVTDVSIAGKVGSVFEGSITLSNNGPPTTIA